MIADFRELVVWQKAMDLVEEVYRLTGFLPKEETFGLVNQMRRAAVSIPSNVAEGQSRHTAKEFLNFLSMARGSKSEVYTQIQICVRLDYITSAQAEKAISLCEEVGKMLYALMSKMQNKS